MLCKHVWCVVKQESFPGDNSIAAAISLVLNHGLFLLAVLCCSDTRACYLSQPYQCHSFGACFEQKALQSPTTALHRVVLLYLLCNLLLELDPQIPQLSPAMASEPVLDTLYELFWGVRRRPAFHAMRLNRIDAYPHLVTYYEHANGVNFKPRPTELLPTRTRVPESYIKSSNIWYEVTMDQSHAYYEEIGNIPAMVMGAQSFFPKFGHWHVIHPIQMFDMEGWNVAALRLLAEWIESRHEIYVGTSEQVCMFKEKRLETLEEIGKELKRRKVGKTADHEGFLGDWEEVMGDFGAREMAKDGERRNGQEKEDEEEEELEGAMTEVYVKEADMEKVYLEEDDMEEVDLDEDDLNGEDLEEIDLNGLELEEAELDDDFVVVVSTNILNRKT